MADDGVIILTGAASGIGRASAEALAKKSRTLALVDVNTDALNQVVQKCRKNSPHTAGFPCDVTDGAAVIRTSEQIHKAFGRVAVLVNCAGIGWHAPFLEIEPEGWMQIFNVNVMGTIHFIRAVLPG
ncbi:MAG: SDR family NAD(P)-dependent oxidoreductase, partial [Terriglobia bacterium]